jgi:hypothetical protein
VSPGPIRSPTGALGRLTPVTVTTDEIMGWLRAAVGAVLVVSPAAFLRLSGREAPSGVSVLLLRTIGIRDLVLGAGTVSASRRGSPAGARRWTSAGLASDSLDVLASLAAGRSIGRKESAGAAGAALVFAVGDLVALGRGRQPERPTLTTGPAG